MKKYLKWDVRTNYVVSYLIRNVGKIVSGDIAKPFVDGDSIYIKDGIIEEIGWSISRKADGIIDVDGMTVIPGLFDSRSSSFRRLYSKTKHAWFYRIFCPWRGNNFHISRRGSFTGKTSRRQRSR
jgi:hypothetical protein